MTCRLHIGFLWALALILTACRVSPTDTAQPEGNGSAPIKKPAAEKQRAEISAINLETFFQLHQSDKALVLDARPSFIYHFGHVPGAINLPKNHCDEAIAKRDSELRGAIKAGKTIVVYCTGVDCPDARTVANHLSDSGIPASVFEGGWDAWHDAGLPVE